ncbi:hypothetical protein HPB50_016776 [Hyalomma asiaticum]|uniref:Uncharacterized protein n=1 Tax=Hyalomma asiaticum TaxID=266040 RepID=A0ACB7SX77_HYAAI|nr:hypothetical protein HPB50_016776 [Hyalomma asiaticum]
METGSGNGKHHRKRDRLSPVGGGSYERRNSDIELDKVTGPPEAFFHQARQSRRASVMAELVIKHLEDQDQEEKKSPGVEVVVDGPAGPSPPDERRAFTLLLLMVTVFDGGVGGIGSSHHLQPVRGAHRYVAVNQRHAPRRKVQATVLLACPTA